MNHIATIIGALSTFRGRRAFRTERHNFFFLFLLITEHCVSTFDHSSRAPSESYERVATRVRVDPTVRYFFPSDRRGRARGNVLNRPPLDRSVGVGLNDHGGQRQRQHLVRGFPGTGRAVGQRRRAAGQRQHVGPDRSAGEQAKSTFVVDRPSWCVALDFIKGFFVCLVEQEHLPNGNHVQQRRTARAQFVRHHGQTNPVHFKQVSSERAGLPEFRVGILSLFCIAVWA